MSFSENQARLSRLQDQNAAWKLLNANSAPFILSVLTEWFVGGDPEISEDRAKVVLESRYREILPQGQDPADAARLHINQWIDSGWLRNQNQKLIITSAAQTALQFVTGLENREMTATASRLESVSAEFRRLVVDLSPDVEERRKLLQAQIVELELAIQRLGERGAEEMRHEVKRERVRNMFSLAMGLAQDFRYLEEEIKRTEDEVQKRTLDDEQSHGSVVIGVLDAEDAMNDSAAGRAFNGFYELLGHPDRNDEFVGQIRRLISLGVGAYLSPDERHRLIHFVRDLTAESKRVIQRRGATTERLNAFILSGDAKQFREMDRLVRRAAQLAVGLKDNPDISWHSDTPIVMQTGKVSFFSPATIDPKMPAQVAMLIDVDQHHAESEISDDELGKLARFRATQVFEATRDTLLQLGPRTLGELAATNYIHGGVEEVLALVRLAIATGAQELGGHEWIYFTDGDKKLQRASVPVVKLDALNFPDDLNEI